MKHKSVIINKKHVLKPIQEKIEPQILEDPIDFKQSLRELFAGTPVMRTPQSDIQDRQPKQYTKNPVLNAVLNETVSDLHDRERLVGAAAFAGGYSPSVSMLQETTPTKSTVLVEGQESSHVPLSSLPEGTSVLDVVKHVPTTPGIKHALTRDYSQMMKLIDKKRGKI